MVFTNRGNSSILIEPRFEVLGHLPWPNIILRLRVVILCDYFTHLVLTPSRVHTIAAELQLDGRLFLHHAPREQEVLVYRDLEALVRPRVRDKLTGGRDA